MCCCCFSWRRAGRTITVFFPGILQAGRYPRCMSRPRQVLPRSLHGEFWKGLASTWRWGNRRWRLASPLLDWRSKQILFWQMSSKNQNLRAFKNYPLAAYQGRRTGHPFAGTCSIKFWREGTGMGDNANWLPRNLECRGRFTWRQKRRKGLVHFCPC